MRIDLLGLAGNSRGRSFGVNEQAATEPDWEDRFAPIEATAGSGQHER